MTRRSNISSDYIKEFSRNTEDLSWLFYEPIEIKINLNNKTIFLSRFFAEQFGRLPKAVFFDDYYVLFLVEGYQLKLIRTKLKNKLNSFRERFANKWIVYKEHGKTLGDLVINLFAQIPHFGLINLKPVIEIIDDKIELQLQLKMKDELMPLALGKKGNYIHFINRVFRDIKFSNPDINQQFDWIRICLRS